VETTVPTNLAQEKFQTMVRNLTSSNSISFTEQDDLSVSQPHNTPLHIVAFIHKHRIKRVLIDGGASLNICTLKLVLALGFSEQAVDPRRKITIKAYDEEERTTKGTVVLPIQVGPVIIDVVCQVLDRELVYNILLGRPWIHAMKAVPSTYHQCIKFLHNGKQVTIQGDLDPYQHCNFFRAKPECVIPNNKAYISPTPQQDHTAEASSSRPKPLKLTIKESGMGEYSIEHSLNLAMMPLSPRSVPVQGQFLLIRSELE